MSDQSPPSTSAHDICFVSAGVYHYLDPDSDVPRGGAQRQQSLLGRRLHERGWSVAFLTGEYGQASPTVLDGMTVYGGCPESLASPLHAPVAVGRLWRAMHRVDADVYYVRGAPRLAILVAIGCRFRRRSLVFCVANDADIEPASLAQRYGPAVRRAYRWMLETADAVVAQTDRQRSLLDRHYGLESVRIPNGYDLPAATIPPHDDREFVLWVGSTDPDQKRPMAVLDLAESLPEVPFAMVARPASDGTHFESVRERAQTIDNLEFVGSVPPDEVHDYYARAAMLVNTSRTEGFPNTFLEAWRYETPVVSLTFDLDGLLASGTGGIYAGSPARLADEVEGLAADPDRRATLGGAGRALVADRYSLDRAVDRYEALLTSLDAN